LPPGPRLAQKNSDVYRARAPVDNPGHGKRATASKS
jgi:hypothetical protein